MSGGEYDYAYRAIQELSERIVKDNSDDRRKHFSRLFSLIADALYEIEWVDSGDKSPGDEYEAINAVFSFLEDELDYSLAVKILQKENPKLSIEQLEDFLKEFKSFQKEKFEKRIEYLESEIKKITDVMDFKFNIIAKFIDLL